MVGLGIRAHQSKAAGDDSSGEAGWNVIEDDEIQSRRRGRGREVGGEPLARLEPGLGSGEASVQQHAHVDVALAMVVSLGVTPEEIGSHDPCRAIEGGGESAFEFRVGRHD
jgi:hypothetical protein